MVGGVGCNPDFVAAAAIGFSGKAEDASPSTTLATSLATYRHCSNSRSCYCCSHQFYCFCLSCCCPYSWPPNGVRGQTPAYNGGPTMHCQPRHVVYIDQETCGPMTVPTLPVGPEAGGQEIETPPTHNVSTAAEYCDKPWQLCH